jgi:hypothetical protein
VFLKMKIIFTAALMVMLEKKECWRKLLLADNATRCNRAGAGSLSATRAEKIAKKVIVGGSKSGIKKATVDL